MKNESSLAYNSIDLPDALRRIHGAVTKEFYPLQYLVKTLLEFVL